MQTRGGGLMYELPLEVIQEARARISDYIRHTPLAPLPHLQNNVPPQLRLKLENLQVAGSFKSRGVFNTLLQLSDEAKKRGVIAASGGNHGLSLAYAAHRLNIPAVVYLPATADADRAARISRWNARVIQHGRNWDDAHAKALEHAEQDGLVYVHAFDTEKTLAGQGTLGLELLDDVPDLDCVLIAIGGGGLISGMATAIRALKPDVRIIGVEPTGSPAMTRSLAAGRVISLPEVRTIADTLSPPTVSDSTLALTQRHVNEVVLVDDPSMIDAMRWLWLNVNQLVEPAGAAVIAALLSGKVDVSHFRQPVALICGGNAAAEPVWSDYEARANRGG